MLAFKHSGLFFSLPCTFIY